MISARIIKRPDFAKISRNIDFGTAMGLTETAKQAQAASIGAIKGTFVTRGNWMEPSNRFGIRIEPATKTKLRAVVKTQANWLKHHEEGTDKRGQGGNVAVPTAEVRRNKRQIIPKAQRPRGLGAKVFKLMTKHGPVLAQRMKRGPRKGVVVLYGLEGSVKIRKRSTFHEPIQKVVDRRLKQNITAGIRKALATMR